MIPPTGAFPEAWFNEFTAPQGLHGSQSAGGWTIGNEGFIQQTFLGASIRTFSISAGFNGSSSSLSVSLVEDEYNKSDGLGLGSGMDAYHNGVGDLFRPPAVGSPVWFTFGTNPATVEQAFAKTYDDTYPTSSPILPPETNYTEYVQAQIQLENTNLPQYHYVDMARSKYDATYTIVDKSSLYNPENNSRGYYHFAFGGLLQSVQENTDTNGKCLITVNVVDPREVLSNCVIILNSWQGETLGIDNIFNVYGFLEYDLEENLQEELDAISVEKSVLIRKVDADGIISYEGSPNPDLLDMYEFGKTSDEGDPQPMRDEEMTSETELEGMEGPLPRYLPITGQGFSRRTDAGIPWYRVSQALKALSETDGELPQDYKKASPDGYSDTGFSKKINFRGFEYIVDFGGLPLDKIPPSYNLEFDQIDILSLAQEICDATSHELFVSLLPVGSHSSSSLNYLDEQNKKIARKNSGKLPEEQNWDGFTVGIIRIDAIDKTKQPEYGAIVEYLTQLEQNNIDITNKNLGFELSNVPTDKVIVGAQEVNLHFFQTSRDRDELQVRRGDDEGAQENVEKLQKDQWLLETSLKQQILPFYGFLGDDKAVTIPKGWGSYQQILLDTRDLNAFGVGNYYIATELELRAALVSFERWKNFLLKYNEVYISDLNPYQYGWDFLQADSENGSQITEVLEGFTSNTGLSTDSELSKEILKQFKERPFGVTVPRSVWNSDRPFMGEDGYPASPCCPPYGYPLYYKRAQKIGIPEAGLIKVFDSFNQVMTNTNELRTNNSNYGSHSTKIAETLKSELAILEERLQQIKQDYKAVSKPYGYLLDSEYISYLAQWTKAKAIVMEYEVLQMSLIERGTKLMAETQGVLSSLPQNVLMANRSHFTKKHTENAQKVYNFVKKVAEENLGKKFLVKIPKTTNLRYQPTVEVYDNKSQNIGAGPFGFQPKAYPSIDIELSESEKRAGLDTKTIQRYPDMADISKLNLNGGELFEHYLNYNIKYYEKTIDPSSSDKYEVSQVAADNAEFSFTNGALRSSYNPISEKWEFNYKPEPLGGWLPFETYDKNASYYTDWSDRERKGAIDQDINQLPPATRDALAPQRLEKMTADAGRIYCYVKYNNSHLLDFSTIPTNDLAQQYTKDGGNNWTPDIATLMPNVRPDQKLSLTQQDIEEKAKEESGSNKDVKIKQDSSVAFVKCEVDERFYMPPKITKYKTPIFATEYTLMLSNLPIDIEKTEEDGCPTYKLVVKPVDPIFSISDGGWDGETKTEITDFVREPLKKVKNSRDLELPPDEKSSAGGIIAVSDEETADKEQKAPDLLIDASLQNLDDNHVYALITVPGRVKSTVDQRWADGPMQAFNTAEIKNLFTQDVVKIDDFKRPAFPDPRITGDDNTKPVVECGKDGVQFDLTTVNAAQEVQRKAFIGARLNEGKSSILNYIQPSPIYPDMVAMPLLSWERCYGPWFSTAIKDNDILNNKFRYYNIGGKVEVVKDETLAPWSYGGYELLTTAGELKAEFSNSLLLISERGGINYVGAPTGVSLGKELKDRGPLVTSINVEVGDQITTSVNLELFTAKFGKLNQQKEDAIAKTARERQKIVDESNNATRRGLGKSQTSMDLMGEVMAQGGQRIVDLANRQQTFFSDIEKKNAQTLLLTNDGITPKDQLQAGLATHATMAASLSAMGGFIPKIIDTANIFQVFTSTDSNSHPSINGDSPDESEWTFDPDNPFDL